MLMKKMIRNNQNQIEKLNVYNNVRTKIIKKVNLYYAKYGVE